VPRSIMSTI